jgi:hypothetical protein
MKVHFKIKGRLGNAIFRYMTSCIICIETNNEYSSNSGGTLELSDAMFLNIAQCLLADKPLALPRENISMNGFYQHDQIYKKFRNQIFSFINEHPEHLIITDGITAGDRKYETFKIYDILNTPIHFKKIYKNVIHLRLEDFVTHNLYISIDKIIGLMDRDILTEDTVCIVCNKPTTPFEHNYIMTLTSFLKKKNKKVHMENNDVLTDYYIMKEAELLICSKSTLSWSAAFFSDKNKICYFPNYTITGPNMTCKYPTDNTILFTC